MYFPYSLPYSFLDCQKKVEKITANEKDENIKTFKEKMDKFLSDGN